MSDEATPLLRFDGIVPPARPEMGKHAAEQLLYQLDVDISRPALLGRRGYYRDSMGAVGVNDRGVYDDAIMLVSPSAYVAFNANCDPSAFQPGIAVLKPGVWRYKIGIHGLTKPKDKQYRALVQAAPVTVLRDRFDERGERTGSTEDTGYFGINIHCGAHHTTSSLGCQTIYPDQWEAFMALVELEMKRYELLTIPYALTERERAKQAA